jgi:hypothetical protein
VIFPSAVVAPFVDTFEAGPPSTAQERVPPKGTCIHIRSAESPVRAKVTDWPDAPSCTNFAFGPPVAAVKGIPASVVGHVNEVSPVDAAPMNPRPPPASPCVG